MQTWLPSATLSQGRGNAQRRMRGVRASASTAPHPAFGHPLPGERERAAADEGGQSLGQYRPSPGLRPDPASGVPPTPGGRGNAQRRMRVTQAGGIVR